MKIHHGFGANHGVGNCPNDGESRALNVTFSVTYWTLMLKNNDGIITLRFEKITDHIDCDMLPFVHELFRSVTTYCLVVAFNNMAL